MPDGSEKEKRPQTQRKGRSEACRFVPAGEIIPCLHPACGFTPDLRIALRLSSPARCLRIYALPISSLQICTGLQICTPFTPACTLSANLRLLIPCPQIYAGLRICTPFTPACEFALRLQTGCKPGRRSDRSDRPETDELSTVNNHGRFRVRLQITILIPSRMAGPDPVSNHRFRFQHRNGWLRTRFHTTMPVPAPNGRFPTQNNGYPFRSTDPVISDRCESIRPKHG